MPTEERFRQIFNRLERHIEDRYAVPVVISDVANPFTGDLDGAEIRVDYEVSLEEAVFIVAHLFGHTIQWNLSADARDIGTRTQQNPTAEQLAALHTYEQEACRYSLQLFHDAGITDVDQWVSDFSACDFAYLRHFYTTGEKRPFKSFWNDGSPLLTPLAIPDFRPERWMSRWQGVVV
jgi:hypothetical protein